MKKNILFVNDEMTMGGVARILNTFLKMINKDDYEVDLLVLHKRGELLSEIPEGINVIGGSDFFSTVDIPLSQCNMHNIFSKIRLLLYMKTGLIEGKIKKERKKILNKEYDIEFSAKEGFCTVFTAYGDSAKKFNWVQVDYKESNYSSNHMGLMKKALKHIDMNIACSDKVRDSYKELFDVERIITVHNLIDEERIYKMSLKKPKTIVTDNLINIICVARFHHQKGLDRLIRVYSRLTDYYNLTIVGDGELKEELYALSKELDVFDKITWTGIMANPYPEIRLNDLFVMPSLYEGYPTITVESLISDTPVLTLEVAGVKEQITKDYEGWVVDNSEESLFHKLNELKDKKELLIEYKNKLKNYHYDNESILKKYYKIFKNS